LSERPKAKLRSTRHDAPPARNGIEMSDGRKTSMAMNRTKSILHGFL
jgi:hypothetical protein